MYNSVNEINGRMLDISREIDGLWESLLYETSKDKIIEVHGKINNLLDEEEDLSEEKCSMIIKHLDNK